jgi:hypothetical protein
VVVVGPVVGKATGWLGVQARVERRTG